MDFKTSVIFSQHYKGLSLFDAVVSRCIVTCHREFYLSVVFGAEIVILQDKLILYCNSLGATFTLAWFFFFFRKCHCSWFCWRNSYLSMILQEKVWLQYDIIGNTVQYDFVGESVTPVSFLKEKHTLIWFCRKSCYCSTIL